MVLSRNRENIFRWHFLGWNWSQDPNIIIPIRWHFWYAFNSYPFYSCHFFPVCKFNVVLGVFIYTKANLSWSNEMSFQCAYFIFKIYASIHGEVAVQPKEKIAADNSFSGNFVKQIDQIVFFSALYLFPLFSLSLSVSFFLTLSLSCSIIAMQVLACFVISTVVFQTKSFCVCLVSLNLS